MGGVRVTGMDDLHPAGTAWRRFRALLRSGRGQGNRQQVPENPAGRLLPVVMAPVFGALRISKMAVQLIWSLPADLRGFRAMYRMLSGRSRDAQKRSQADVIHD